MRKVIPILLLSLVITACPNQDINEGEEFRPRQVDDSFQGVKFSKVTVDGIAYLMLERDNNNPHEGFGFMSFRPNEMMLKQDSIIAQLNTMRDMQAQIYARLFNISQQEADSLYAETFRYYLSDQRDLIRLNQETLTASENDESN